MASVTQKLSNINLYSSTTVVPSAYQVGMKVDGVNGKSFRYVLAGASNLVVGNLLQSAVADTQFINMAVTASAIATGGSAQTVNVTNGTTTVAANQFDGGSISVYTTGGDLIGNEYTIVSHTTGTSGAALVLTLDRPITVAWTTSLKVNMMRSPWSGVIQAPTTQTGVPAGVAIFAIPAASYGWVQTKGITAVLSDSSTYAIGSEVGTPCANTAGAPAVYAAGTTHSRVGTVLQAQASTHAVAINLCID